MGFGTGSFGAMPFGSTEVELFDSFEVLFAEPISASLIRIVLSEYAVVNNDYKNPNSYAITDFAGSYIPVLNVLTPKDLSVNYVLLRVRPQALGQSYGIVVTNIMSRSGVVISDTVNSYWYLYNSTKTDSILASIPSIYDKSPGTDLNGILTAISLEDNLIGGTPLLPATVPAVPGLSAVFSLTYSGGDITDLVRSNAYDAVYLILERTNSPGKILDAAYISDVMNPALAAVMGNIICESITPDDPGADDRSIVIGQIIISVA